MTDRFILYFPFQMLRNIFQIVHGVNLLVQASPLVFSGLIIIMDFEETPKTET
jgi:hypothetical protein